MSKNQHSAASTITVAVTPNLKAAFDDVQIKGQGGFQALIREVSKRITESQGVVRFTPDEFRRVSKYATTYGEGGYQMRLRLLVAQFVNQNFNTLIKG